MVLMRSRMLLALLHATSGCKLSLSSTPHRVQVPQVAKWRYALQAEVARAPETDFQAVTSIFHGTEERQMRFQIEQSPLEFRLEAPPANCVSCGRVASR